MHRPFLALFSLIILVVLSACSSSDSPVDENLLPENNAPRVILPEWVITNGGENVLIVSEVRDNDSTSHTYSWRQTLGPAVTLNNVSSDRLAFVAPSASELLRLEFELTVTDVRGGVGTGTVDVYVTRPDTGLVQGKIVDANSGAPVANATVSADNFSTVSNSQGRYALFDISYNPRTIITVEHDNYSKQSQIVAVSPEEPQVNSTIAIIPADILTFSASQGASISTQNSSASVSITANSLVDSSGMAYSGDVTAKISAINTSNNVYLMPGDYTINNGLPIETFGGINIELFDDSGERLSLAQGETITANFNVASASNSPLSPTDIFGYDFSTGRWTAVDSGSISNGKYLVTSNRVTSLAAGSQYNFVYITGCVVDLLGNPVSNITVKSEGVRFSGTTQTFTDSAGDFSIRARQNSDLLLFASRAGSVSNTALESVGASDIDLPNCFTLAEGAIRLKLTWGDSPSDLDSHLVGPNYHVYYVNKGSLTQAPFAQLDVDDVDGEGPEIITISQFDLPGEYSYSVYNYSRTQNPGITESPTVVELNIDGDLQVFSPPAGEGNNYTWNVLTFVVDNNGNYTVRVDNTWSQSEPN